MLLQFIIMKLGWGDLEVVGGGGGGGEPSSCTTSRTSAQNLPCFLHTTITANYCLPDFIQLSTYFPSSLNQDWLSETKTGTSRSCIGPFDGWLQGVFMPLRSSSLIYLLRFLINKMCPFTSGEAVLWLF